MATENTEEGARPKSRFKGIENFVNTTGLKFPFKYLSISQINTYLMCPKSYYWKYIEGRPSDFGPKSIVGNVGHTVLELLTEAHLPNVTEDDIRNLFDMTLQNELENIAETHKTEEFMQELQKNGDGIFKSLSLYSRLHFPKLKIIAPEVQVDAPVPVMRMDTTYKGSAQLEKLGDITFAGFVDFINYKGDRPTVEVTKQKEARFSDLKINVPLEELEVGDYKTGSVKDNTYFSTDIQSPFYALATGINNVRIDNIPLSRTKLKKDGSPYANNIPPSYNILKYKITNEDFSSMTEQLSQAALGIGVGAYPMCHSTFWKCSESSCSYWSHCRGRSTAVYVDNVSIESVKE